MIDFSNKTYKNILAEQLERISDSLDKRQGSMIQTALGPESWYIEGVYLTLNQVQQNAYILTAVGQYLDYIAAGRGITRNAATPAQREGVFDVAVPVGSRFSTINGAASINFAVMAAPTLNEDGYYHATMLAETAGTDGNSYTGALLPITFVEGLTYAQLTTIVVSGTNEEQDEELRSRYLSSLLEQPFAGNIVAYRQEILDIDNIGAVQIYPFWQGGGTVMCSVLDANYNIATTALIEQVQQIVCPPEQGQSNPTALGYGFAPIGALVTIQTGTEVEISLSTSVELQTGYDLSAIQTQVAAVLEEYLLARRKEWGTPVSGQLNEYSIYLYISQINAAILDIPGVVNVTGTTLNGEAADIHLTENASVQQVPVKGSVVVTNAG